MSLVADPVVEPETPYNPSSTPRVGVFLCRCGNDIAAILDLPALVEELSRLSAVARVEVVEYLCMGQGLASLKTAVLTHHIDRVVVGGCSPRTHLRAFRQVMRDTGVHPGALEMVNLREHCARVHSKSDPDLHHKALDLLRMAVARSAAWKPPASSSKPSARTAAVIGAGIAGLSAATVLAKRGIHVILLEKASAPGGLCARLGSLYPSGEDPAMYIEKKVAAIELNSRIDLRLRSTVNQIVRTPGGYRLYLEPRGDGTETVDVSLVLLATGARLLEPSEVEGWDGHGVTSLLELESMVKSEDMPARQVVMVLCAGARCAQRPYCARVCCMAALKNARLLRRKNPAITVTLLCRDIAVNCINRLDIKNAVQEGIRFIRYDPAVQPRRGDSGSVIYRTAEGEDCELHCDLVVPVTPLVPHDDTPRLAKMIGLPVDAHGFVVAPQVKLKPEWPLVPGMGVTGAAHWPCSTSEAIRQAVEVATTMARWLDEPAGAPEAITATVDLQHCIGCGLCRDICPFNAAGMTTVGNEQKAFIVEAACRGCGICGAGCPALAITMNNHSHEQLRAQIRALGTMP